MKTTQLSIIAVIIGYILLVSYSSNPPIGRTGAPGEATCLGTGCHVQNNNIDGEIIIEGFPDEWLKNTTYDLRINLIQLSGDPLKGGFQMTVINTNNNPIGVISSDGNGTNVGGQNGERQYIGHSPAANFGSDTITYTASWKSPALDDQKAIFYIAANFANGDGGNTGDRIVLKSFNIPGSGSVIDADNDGFPVEVDCNDQDSTINPMAVEIPNNDIDEDCDGIAQIIDLDNDGFFAPFDCDDLDSTVNPMATEIINNDIDENCDGIIEMIDNDNDGFNSSVDCNDNNPSINPGAVEIPNNSIDENCDGVIDSLDADNDGFLSDVDCDDNDPNINPDAVEIDNNFVDENCDGILGSVDADNDGYNSDIDCNDNDPNINPDAIEINDNNIDENCDGIIGRSSVAISGQVLDYQDRPISNVQVTIEGLANTITTDSEGKFRFVSISNNINIKLIAEKNINHGNGLSSLDLVQIINHILGINEFSNERQLQAADANNDQRVSSLDIVQFTNVILGNWTELPNRQSWEFSNTSIPAPESNVDDIVIRGFKIGDVDGSANPQN